MNDGVTDLWEFW